LWKSSPALAAAPRRQARWEPPAILPSDSALEQKFRWLVNPILGEARTAALVELIWQFEPVDEAGALVSTPHRSSL
jgi:hypothetical protein